MKLGPLIRRQEITVRFLADRLVHRLRVPLEQVNEVDASAKTIREREIHRPGLALAGFTDLFTYHRVQVLGNTECRFLNKLNPEQRRQAFSTLLAYEIPCIIMTDSNKNTDYPELTELATEKGIPLFTTTYESSKLIYLVTDFLDDQFSPQQSVHGVFLDVYGIGILITGRSGIGKSEIGLDLIERGHRLVSDDVVMITRKGEGILMGSSNNMVQHFMEIRGVGIIDIRSIFGVRAIRFQKRVEIVVELLDWNPDEEYTRTGLDTVYAEILGVKIPKIELAIFAGKNVTVILETVALNHLLKHYGYDSAQVFADKLQSAIERKTRVKAGEEPDRTTEYFEHDFE
ncbi:MAG: HPr kinase/phosphorylase [Bacteroidetes bacterium]|nr:HPr kinase/phosphorylase [Bacteroidota bacterium]